MSQTFSNVTKTYLSNFYEILDQMEEGMTSAALRDSVSYNFIVQMIPHHQGAVEMAQNILHYTTFVPLQEVAQGIIQEQNQSIAAMEAALEHCMACTSSPQDLGLYARQFEQVSRQMFCRMAQAKATNDINANFIREMIPHHQGAIQMADNALRFPLCEELQPILQSIIRSQSAGIRQMERLLSMLTKGQK
ncbi:MAG: DUF305 domain-containing protein [Ruminiclostridium sp.]|nr:DUF305 domain-containing protein [Ruminiclostridium sp.]